MKGAKPNVVIEDVGSTLAAGLLKKSKKLPSAPVEEPIQAPAAHRPARLGLGATPAKKAVGEEAQDKLKKQLRKGQKRKQDDEDDEPEDIEAPAEDSKTLSAPRPKQMAFDPLDLVLEAKSKKKKKAKAPSEPTPPTKPDSTPSAPVVPTVAAAADDDDAFATNWDDPNANLPAAVQAPPALAAPSFFELAADARGKPTKSAPTSDSSATAKAAPSSAAKSAPAEPGKPGKNATVATATTSASEASGNGEAPRKRKKIRSKQKNLRKDTRPEHLRPTYRTPGAADYKTPNPSWKKRGPPTSSADS
eukprot:m.165530 g.165530  ORF g.165530 m.165530 type:complete len:305 (+) comp9894_c0_seq2:1868-2782(+)